MNEKSRAQITAERFMIDLQVALAYIAIGIMLASIFIGYAFGLLTPINCVCIAIGCGLFVWNGIEAEKTRP